MDAHRTRSFASIDDIPKLITTNNVAERGKILRILYDRVDYTGRRQRTDFHLLLSSGVPLSRIAPVLAQRCDRDSELRIRCFGISRSHVPLFERIRVRSASKICFRMHLQNKICNDLTRRIRCTRVGRCAFGHGSDVCGLISTGAWNREIADAEGEMPRNG